jgi:sensor domain CHASE-containing protein
VTRGAVPERMIKMNVSKIKKSVNNLGSIVTALLFLIVIITLLLNSILNNVIISKYFSKVEKESAISSANQSKKVFQLKINELERIVQDYAFWDGNYDRVQAKNVDEIWYRENFTEWLPNKYDIDLIVISYKNKKIIVEYGLNNSNNILNDGNLLQSLNEDKSNKKTGVSGFIKHDGDIYLISESPILKNTSEGSSQGVVILGRKVSSLLIEKITEEFDSNIFITYDNKIVSNQAISKAVNKTFQ